MPRRIAVLVASVGLVALLPILSPSPSLSRSLTDEAPAPETGPATAGETLADSVAGIPADLVGQHGPAENWLDGLRLVAHSPLRIDGLALGNHGAVALIDDCAYVGRWHDYTGNNGIQILDISGVDPATSDVEEPPVIGNIPATARSGGVVRELRAIDLPDFEMLVVMVFGQGLGDRRNNLLQFFTFPDGDCTKPVLTGTFDMVALRGHEFFLWLDPDPAHDVNGHPRVLVYVTAPPGPPSFIVVDASNPARPLPVGSYETGIPVVSQSDLLGRYAHSISLSADGKEAYLSYWDAGFLTVDTTAFAVGGAGTAVAKGAMSVPYGYEGVDGHPGNTHSAVKIPGRNVVVVGDENYASVAGCPYGWMRTIDIGSPAQPPTQIGEFRLVENRKETCDGVTVKWKNSLGNRIYGTFSAHNQTVTPNYALFSWYGGGMRVIDVSEPATPVEAGAFVPAPLAEAPKTRPTTSAPVYGESENDWQVAVWSYPVVRDGLIYVTDVRNGLYVLAPSDGAPFAEEIEGIGFLEGNSNVGDFVG